MSKLKYFFALTLLIIAIVILANSLGIFECGSCSPSDPLDPDTQTFIASDVNQHVSRWRTGDYVLIYNPNNGHVSFPIK